MEKKYQDTYTWDGIDYPMTVIEEDGNWFAELVCPLCGRDVKSGKLCHSYEEAVRSLNPKLAIHIGSYHPRESNE